MPKREELTQSLYSRTHSYSLSVKGTPALLRSEIVTQVELVTGDKVRLFGLLNGKIFLDKVDASDELSYTIGRVTPAHIYFDDEIDIKEI